jgi:hypothetical protein
VERTYQTFNSVKLEASVPGIGFSRPPAEPLSFFSLSPFPPPCSLFKRLPSQPSSDQSFSTSFRSPSERLSASSPSSPSYKPTLSPFLSVLVVYTPIAVLGPPLLLEGSRGVERWVWMRLFVEVE